MKRTKKVGDKLNTIDDYQEIWKQADKQIKQGGLTNIQIRALELTKQEAHDKAENIRKSYGFSGGEDGSKLIPIADDIETEIDESGRFDAFFGGTNVESERQRRIRILEKNAYVDDDSGLVILGTGSKKVKDIINDSTNGIMTMVEGQINKGVGLQDSKVIPVIGLIALLILIFRKLV